MRELLLSRLNIKKIALQTSKHYKSFTGYDLDKPSINAICYILLRAYLKRHFYEPNQTFTPNAHPQLQTYLRAMDIDKDSPKSLYEKHDKAIAEASERVVNNVITDLEEEYALASQYEAEKNQTSDEQRDIAQNPSNYTDHNPTISEQHQEIPQDPCFQVFDHAAFRALYEKGATLDKEIRRVIKEIDEKDSGIRRLQRIGPDFNVQIQSLKERYPNMLPFLDFVDKHAALSTHNHYQEFYMPPVLLVSKPGLGKTACVKEVASVIGVPYGFTDWATISANWIMVGVSAVWHSAKPGMLYDILINQSKAANALILCDEIDKSSASNNEKYPPLNVFYRLLEKDVMKEFQDEYVPQLKLDASKIMYVATANSLENIPDAILSRFHIIHINPPNKSQLRAISKSIYQSILDSESYKTFSTTLNEDVIDSLMSYSPRQIKVVLKHAFASAAYRCRHNKDLEVINIEANDLELPEAETERQIGFVWK